MDAVWPYIAAIVPTILVATLFYFLIKGMIEGDRRERLAQSRFEAAEDRRRATAVENPGPTPPSTPHGADPVHPGDGPANSTTDS